LAAVFPGISVGGFGGVALGVVSLIPVDLQGNPVILTESGEERRCFWQLYQRVAA
jgi:hypothetical protein